MSDVEEAITRAHHEEWARVVAALTRRYGDLDIAEDSADGMAPTRRTPSAARDRSRVDLAGRHWSGKRDPDAARWGRDA